MYARMHACIADKKSTVLRLFAQYGTVVQCKVQVCCFILFFLFFFLETIFCKHHTCLFVWMDGWMFIKSIELNMLYNSTLYLASLVSVCTLAMEKRTMDQDDVTKHLSCISKLPAT